MARNTGDSRLQKRAMRERGGAHLIRDLSTFIFDQ